MTGRADPSPRHTPSHVVATAGHVDHGKSTLIRALTGIDPDRLEEEKRRGLTIDLGFAWCTLPSGREIGFVDVPGHERFVRTMLAGVGPVRLVLFVVAADEGWKPQSEEHLAIVDVLGVDGAVIALTKSDAVDRSRLDDAELEVREHVHGTALADAPIVACSATTGSGVDAVLSALDAMIASSPAPQDAGRPRLFVDRVFTISGAGTVVTGTLTGGRLRVGEDVELVPGGERARIRALQTHERPVDEARPVSRVAVNLAGLDRADVARGETLGHVATWPATSSLEARITPVRGLRHELAARGAYTLHAGTAEREAALRVYGDRVGQEGAFVRIRLSQPLALDVFDRFVLRESGRRETVAGGIVLDADPPGRPGPEPERRLAARAAASRSDLPTLAVAERGVLARGDIERLAGAAVGSVRGAGEIGDAWVSESLLADVRGELEARLADGATDATEARSVIETTLRRRRIDGRSLAGAMLDRLVETGAVDRAGTALVLPGHHPSADEDAVARLVEAVRAGEPMPPTVAELHADGLPISALADAVASGALVRISPELVVTHELVTRALDAVRAAGEDGITVSALRQALGTSRKYAVPLIEHLDRTGATRRDGDLRFARGA